MKKTFALILLSLCFITSAHAQWPFGTPTPAAPKPSPAPADGGTWVKLPVVIQTAHPYVTSDCRNEQLFPVNFMGATSIKIILKKAVFNTSADLDILNGSGSVVQSIPGNSRAATTYIIPGDRLTIRWKCYYSNSMGEYGFAIEEIYASLQ